MVLLGARRHYWTLNFNGPSCLVTRFCIGLIRMPLTMACTVVATFGFGRMRQRLADPQAGGLSNEHSSSCQLAGKARMFDGDEKEHVPLIRVDVG